MSGIRRSSWSSFVLGACTVAAVAVGSNVVYTASASSPAEAPEDGARHESAGFSSPEDAVSAYLEGMAQRDLSVMVGAFAIETYAANYDLTAYLELIGAYGPTAPILLPSSDPFNVALNTESRYSRVVSSIMFQYLTLSYPDFEPMEVHPLPDDAAIDTFVEDLSAHATSEGLSSIESFTFVPLEEVSADAYEHYVSDNNRQNMTRRDSIAGADESTDVAVRFPTGGDDVYALFSLVRYGDMWWIQELGGTFAVLIGLEYTNSGIVAVDQAGQ
jgi:hypothetical protein